jgi:flagellar hook-associated protein 2
MTSVSSATSTAATAAAAATTASSSSSTSSTKSTASTDISNIDWDSIIEASVQAKLSKADSIDLKITNNQAKIAAYQNLQSLLSTLQTSAQSLRAPSGTLAKTDDLFQDRTAYLTANGSVDASSSVSVTTQSGAQIGTHDLQIVQLAKAQKVAGTAVADSSADLGYAGVFSLGTASGTTANITVTATMSMSDLAATINTQSATTGVQASVLKVADSQYELVLTTAATGETITTSSVSGDDVLNKLGVTASDGSFTDELQASKQAIIKMDGVTITRSTNDISDIFDGMTFHLYQTTPTDTSISVDVGTDLSGIATTVQSLVDSYNAVREFVTTQQSVGSDGTASSSSVLFGDGTVRNISQAIYNALNTKVGGTSMADIGLTFDSSNNLVLDTSKLNDALLDNLDTVKSLLSFQMTTSSSDLLLLDRGTAAPSSFTIDVTVDSSGNLSGASIGGDSSMFTISGTRIVGNAGTAFDGYSFVYAGTTSQSIDVTVSSGIAEGLYTASDAASNTKTGTLESLIDNITDTDNDLQTQSDTIKSQADTYRTSLTNRYAKYQAAIESAESMKSYLDALLKYQTTS